MHRLRYLFFPSRERLLLQLTLYYVILALIFGTLITGFPEIIKFLPVGGAEKLLSMAGGSSDLLGSVQTDRFKDGGMPSLSIFLFISIVCTVLLMLPISWVYIGTHRKKKVEQAIVQVIIVLPITVTGLVLIVQNSLALAFSLAGIVAGSGVRFRTSVGEVSDFLYFLAAIGVGLSAGIGAIGIAAVMSVCFCYVTVLFQVLDFGITADVNMKRHLRKGVYLKKKSAKDEVEISSPKRIENTE